MGLVRLQSVLTTAISPPGMSALRRGPSADHQPRSASRDFNPGVGKTTLIPLLMMLPPRLRYPLRPMTMLPVVTRRERVGRTLSGGVRLDPCRFGADGFSLPSSVVPSRSARSGALVPGGGPGPQVAGSVARPRARVPGPGNPRPAVTASAGQCDWGPWAAPSGDPGTPRPPWAANPGVFPQPTFAIGN